MLHAWEKYGLESAGKEFFERYDKKNRNPEREPPSFRDIVNGKMHFIAHIRDKKNEHDKVYSKLKKKFDDLIKEEDSIPKYTDNESLLPVIITEGHTDWKHLENAFKVLKLAGKYDDFEVDFWRYDHTAKFGDSVLKKYCKKQSHKSNNRKYICIFDRDTPEIVKEMGGQAGLNFRNWGNNVFSFCIPVPSHRKGYHNISIEMYYSDSEVNTVDSEKGTRLFFTNQIKETKESNLTTNVSEIKREVLTTPISENELNKKIFDYKVESIKNPNGVQLAHSKTRFASRIHSQHKDFVGFNLSEFEKVFDIIREISSENFTTASPTKSSSAIL
jgi:hypothetical protein